jgi:predicted  nucleic acid-binding Zn-ribbon protein
MSRAKCIDCGGFFSSRRYDLGYKTCLECGEENIRAINEQLKNQCAPAYNKGAYMFITDMQMVKDLGR